jgi:hypothetical protein
MDHTVRTENNVRDSDGTLMFYRGRLQGGSAYAVLMAQRLKRPVLAIDVAAPPDPAEVVAWLARHGVRRVHIGGQREVTSPGIYAQAGELIRNILRLALRQGA